MTRLKFGNLESALNPQPGEWVYYQLTFIPEREHRGQVNPACYVANPLQKTAGNPVRKKAVLLPDDLWRFE